VIPRASLSNHTKIHRGVWHSGMFSKKTQIKILLYFTHFARNPRGRIWTKAAYSSSSCSRNISYDNFGNGLKGVDTVWRSRSALSRRRVQSPLTASSTCRLHRSTSLDGAQKRDVDTKQLATSTYLPTTRPSVASCCAYSERPVAIAYLSLAAPPGCNCAEDARIL